MAVFRSALSKVVAGATSMKRQFSRRERRSWTGSSRVHVEVRDVRGPERAILAWLSGCERVHFGRFPRVFLATRVEQAF